MKVLRTTVVQPLTGHREEVTSLLRNLGGYLSQQPGFIAGYEAEGNDNALWRVSVWQTKEDADHAANHVHTIALRARLNARTMPNRQDHLVEILQERLASPATTEAATAA